MSLSSKGTLSFTIRKKNIAAKEVTYMRIAIDVMGGDNAPHAIIEGALLAAKGWPDVEIILVGDSARIKPFVTEQLVNISIHHAAEMIEGEDEPVRAVRRKKDASMVVAGR